MRKYLNALVFCLAVNSFFTPNPTFAQAQNEITQAQANNPSLEECMSNNLEYLSCVKEIIQGNFDFSFIENQTKYSFSFKGESTFLDVEKITSEGKMLYKISCRAGLINESECIKILNFDDYESKKLVSYFVTHHDLNNYMYAFFDQRTEIEINSPSFQLEFRQVFYEGLLSFFRKFNIDNDIFRPKIMPLDYFNSLTGKGINVMKIVEKYGILGSEASPVSNMFPPEKELKFEIDGRKYFVTVTNPFIVPEAYLMINEDLEKNCKISLSCDWDSDLIVEDNDKEYRLQYYNNLDLNPVTFEIEKGIIGRLLNSFVKDALFEEIEPGDVYEEITQEVIESNPRLRKTKRDVENEVDKTYNYLIQNYPLE